MSRIDEVVAMDRRRFLRSALAGGALTLILLAARKFGAVYAPVLPAPLGRHLEPAGDIPYGVAIAAGGLLAIAQSDLLPRLV